ncbi:MAG: CsgG/HfaB family protein, partial [Thermodesulfobacteriota bacterium]|nr:CsgG/HfaB family protein [Thermodesulfobacteriota bacterium]
MVKRLFSTLFIFLFMLIFLSLPSQAGQVVTNEMKLWAKEALKKEKELETTVMPKSVAVLYFHNKTGLPILDILQKGIAIMLMTDLSMVKEINLIERVKMQALVEELGLGVSGLVTPETTSRTGKLLRVEHLVGGGILKGEIDEFQFHSSLLKVTEEKISGEPAVEGKLLAELFRMEKDLLFKIIEELKIELSPEKEAELRTYLTTNLNALFYFFDAIEHCDRLDYIEAIEFCKKALREDPNLTLAKELIREIQDVIFGKTPLAFLEPGEAEAYSKRQNNLVHENKDDNIDDEDPYDRDVDDNCPSDPAKTDPGICGCGVADTDTDSDGVPDCNDGCPLDPAKTDPG